MKTLTANDICRGDFYIGDKCCLLGHLSRVQADPETLRQVQHVMYDVIVHELEVKNLRKLQSSAFITMFNDDLKYSLDLIARVWNRAMFRAKPYIWQYGYSCDIENQPLEPFKEHA